MLSSLLSSLLSSSPFWRDVLRGVLQVEMVVLIRMSSQRLKMAQFQESVHDTRKSVLDIYYRALDGAQELLPVVENERE